MARKAAKPVKRPVFRCNDCRVDIVKLGEFYMLNPEIWEGELGLGWDDNLCIGCLEKRLGRQVGPMLGRGFTRDFMQPPNYPWLIGWSDRLEAAIRLDERSKRRVGGPTGGSNGATCRKRRRPKTAL